MCIRDRDYRIRGIDDPGHRHPDVLLTDVAQAWAAASATGCLLYTSDAADERSSVDLGGRRIIKKKKIVEHM